PATHGRRGQHLAIPLRGRACGASYYRWVDTVLRPRWDATRITDYRRPASWMLTSRPNRSARGSTSTRRRRRPHHLLHKRRHCLAEGVGIGGVLVPAAGHDQQTLAVVGQRGDVEQRACEACRGDVVIGADDEQGRFV